MSSSFIPWTGSRKRSNEVEKVRWKRPNRSQQMLSADGKNVWYCRGFKMWQTSFSCISKPASPASFFSRFLHDLVVSCLLHRIAPVRSVQVNRTQPFAKTCQYTTWQKQTCQNMPQQTCQIMSGYHLSKINKDTGIKHGSRPPEGKSKAIVAATAHAQITNALQCVTRSILCTKHAKSCQDTTCQHISRINRRHQTCQ